MFIRDRGSGDITQNLKKVPGKPEVQVGGENEGSDLLHQLSLAKAKYGDKWEKMNKKEKREALLNLLPERLQHLQQEESEAQNILDNINKSGKLSFKDKIKKHMAASKKNKISDKIKEIEKIEEEEMKTKLTEKYGPGGDWKKKLSELADTGGKSGFVANIKAKKKQAEYIIDNLPFIIADTIQQTENKMLKILQDQATIYLLGSKIDVDILEQRGNNDTYIQDIMDSLNTHDKNKVVLNRIAELKNLGEPVTPSLIWNVIQKEIINKFVSGIMEKSLTSIGNKLIVKAEVAKAQKELNKRIEDQMKYGKKSKAEAINNMAELLSNLNSEKGLD